MRFGILGPVLVEQAGTRIAIPSAQLRTLLAALLVEANDTVAAADLERALWGDRAPASARASLHNQVMRLRRQLGPEIGARIRTVAPGYLIEVRDGELDEQVFLDRCAQGRQALQAGDWADAAEQLAAALALWRGEPATDLPDCPAATARIHQLAEIRLSALEGHVDAELHRGRHQEAIAEIRPLISEHPLVEAFHGQLMLALYRSARQAEALDTFQRLRGTLVDELGAEPSPPLQELHRRILNADPELTAAPRAADATSTPNTVAGHSSLRYQLPADTRVFTGRARELDELIVLAREAPRGTDAGMVVISAIDGMAGIGKTALAVHAAHQVRAAFPDGQLFIDLHGHTPGLEPLNAGDALDWLLRSLGVPPQQIPQDLGVRAAFYRDRLADTRTLIVLDNAASTAQVRPLLPSSPGCLVLVTSRKRLTGLDDAHCLPLDILPEADAIALLHKAAGPGRIPAQHPAIPELIALCGHMPLALRITAARLRHRRALRIEDVIGQLRDDNARLRHLQDEDRSLTAVFESSYTALPAPEQHLFRQLGLVPGADFDAYTAANLTGSDHRTAERLLESLLDHNLLTQHTPGRYQFHDLIRVYARTLSDSDSRELREAALDRLLDYYQHTAHEADRHLARYTRPGPIQVLAPAPAQVPVQVTAVPAAAPELPDRPAGLAWMRTERNNLLSCIAYATTQGQPERVIALTASLAAFLRQEGRWQQAVALHRTAASTARERGDRLGEANALYDLGRVPNVPGDHAAVVTLHEQALALYQALGNRLGEANAVFELGRTRQLTGEYSVAADLLERALAIYRDLGDRLGEANALWDLGRVHYLTGDYSAAASLHERALALYQDLGDRLGEGGTRHDLGRTRFATGDFPAGTALLELALATFKELGNRHAEADALHDLGRGQSAVGNYAAAADLQERALALYQDLDFQLNAAHALRELGRVRLATGQYTVAAELLERALVIFRDLGHHLGEANALHDLGRVRQATGDLSAAAELLKRARPIYQDLGHRQGEAEVLTSTGALAAETAGPQEALPLYRQALRVAREIHSPLDEARALEGAARCTAQTGDCRTALADLREAVRLYQRIGAAETGTAAAFLAALENESPYGDRRHPDGRHPGSGPGPSTAPASSIRHA
jgi:DNA-binding SARP family transcriptional activator/tetratricopeptide (TPR) repeat protein